jgi:hypothetical protein
MNMPAFWLQRRPSPYPLKFSEKAFYWTLHLYPPETEAGRRHPPDHALQSAGVTGRTLGGMIPSPGFSVVE